MFKILVADDSQPTADMLQKIFQALGCQAMVARGGEEAIHVAASFCPDFVFMDLAMPNIDGYQATEIIRKQEWGKNMQIYALSGMTQEQDRNKAVEVGFDGFLVKPVGISELKKILNHE